MVKVYLDGADLETMRLYRDKVAGFTSNPSLIRKSGITDYKAFALSVLDVIQGDPISFEVLADDFEGMNRQAREISSWGENVYVKIPACLTSGESCASLIRRLSQDGIKLNVTAVMTYDQINTLTRCLLYAPAILSIFCGRISDTGRDPIPFIMQASRVKHHDTKILWASTREVYNYYQANQVGCDIITMSSDLIKKLELKDYNLAQYSRETVQQFVNDGQGLTL